MTTATTTCLMRSNEADNPALAEPGRVTSAVTDPGCPGGGATQTGLGCVWPNYYYCPQTKFGESNVFTHICHSVHRGEGVSVGGVSLTETPCTETSRTLYGKEREVRILLECILVRHTFCWKLHENEKKCANDRLSFCQISQLRRKLTFPTNIVKRTAPWSHCLVHNDRRRLLRPQ